MSEIQSIATNNYLLATQQEVSHDNTLSGNGTVDSPLGVVPGYNETVLWSGTYTANSGTYFTVSESITNFEKIEFTFNRKPNDFSCVSETFVPTTNSFVLYNINMNDNDTGINLYSTKLKYTDADLKFTTNTQVVKTITTSISQNTTSPITITKVIGINRKA